MKRILKNAILILPLLILLVISGPVCAAIQKQSNHSTEQSESEQMFEKAVSIIKKYETMHHPRHWPFVGYGHKVLPGEKFNRKKTLSEAEADALLRKDLRKNCKYFRAYGKDSLLLAVLAYNIGTGATSRSTVVKKLKAGDRDIKANYINHCRYRGKVHNQIKRRRTEEFETLFISDSAPKTLKNTQRGDKLASNTPVPDLVADVEKVMRVVSGFNLWCEFVPFAHASLDPVFGLDNARHQQLPLPPIIIPS